MHTKKERDIMKSFGKRLAKVRKEKGFTQDSLAEAANVDRMTIASIETGLRWPRIGTIQSLASTLNVKLEYLFKDV